MGKTNVIKSRFSIDDGVTWNEGYTHGMLWNGWACPSFTVIEAMAVAATLTKMGVDLKYDKEMDAFVYTDEQGFEEHYYKYSAEYEGSTIYLYPIGSYGWCWQDVAWQSLT